MHIRRITCMTLVLAALAGPVLAGDAATKTHEGLEVTLRPVRRTFAPEEDLPLEVVYRNISRKPISIANPNFGWKIQLGDWAAQPTVDAAIAERTVTIRPGGTHVAKMMDLGYRWTKGGPASIEVRQKMPEGIHDLEVTVELHMPAGKQNLWTGPVKLGPVPLLVSEAAAQKTDPLVAELIARQQTYLLSEALAAEKVAETLADQARRGEPQIKPPAVDLVLRIRNTGGEKRTINLGGDASQLDLRLLGPGTVNLDFAVMMTMEFRMGKNVTIRPGEYLDIPVQDLRHGKRGIGAGSYWTQPGTVFLQASYVTPVGKADADPGRAQALTARPIALHVVAPDAAIPALQAHLAAKSVRHEIRPDLSDEFSAARIRKMADDPRQLRNLPEPPTVDLTLTIKNTCDKALTLNTGGDASRLRLHLVGPEAVNLADLPVMMSRELRLGKNVTLRPGESVDIQIDRLAWGMRDLTGRSYWLRPGRYWIRAEYITPVKQLGPDGKLAAGRGEPRPTVTTPSVRLWVVNKKK